MTYNKCFALNGRVLTLIQEPMMFELLNDQCYVALAVDEERRWYQVIWDCVDGVCEWDKPSSATVLIGDTLRLIVRNGDVIEATPDEFSQLVKPVLEKYRLQNGMTHSIVSGTPMRVRTRLVGLVVPDVTDNEFAGGTQFITYARELCDVYADGGAEALLKVLNQDEIDSRHCIEAIESSELVIPGCVFGEHGALARLLTLTAAQQEEFFTFLYAVPAIREERRIAREFGVLQAHESVAE
jgi:hypothetical protein